LSREERLASANKEGRAMGDKSPKNTKKQGAQKKGAKPANAPAKSQKGRVKK
jgi:hypothetical protein